MIHTSFARYAILFHPLPFVFIYRCVVHGHSFYFAVLIPVVLILIINFAGLLMVMRSLSSKTTISSNQSQSGKIRQLRITFAFATLLGSTWILGLFAVGDLTYSFQIIFTVFNSFQGFFIFVLNTLMNKDVQKEWTKYWSCRRFKCCYRWKKEWEVTHTDTNVGTSTNDTSYPLVTMRHKLSDDKPY